MVSLEPSVIGVKKVMFFFIKITWKLLVSYKDNSQNLELHSNSFFNYLNLM